MNTNLTKDVLILIVDDIEGNLFFLEELLESEGYHVICALSGQEAIAIVEENPPDLILLDLMMPKMDGIEVCQILKQNPHYAEIPIIFLTASHETDDLVDAFGAGASDYLTKPYKLPELFARVKTHLDLKITRDQLKKSLAEQQKLTQELKKLATIDSLTEIANRRYFFSLADKELSRLHRYHSKAFTVMMLDLDHFKTVNDTYGHGIGDQVLKHMTEITTKCLRKVDIFGRLGGEEFAILLPRTDLAQARVVAERIRSTLEEYPLETENLTILITVSIGISLFQENDQSIDQVLSRADQALYQAKAQGRNQICLQMTEF